MKIYEGMEFLCARTSFKYKIFLINEKQNEIHVIVNNTIERIWNLTYFQIAFDEGIYFVLNNRNQINKHEQLEDDGAYAD